MMLDAHCHIDQFPDSMTVAEDCERKGVTTVAVTNLPSHYRAGLEPVKRFRHVK
jgi:TatD DNase family protein